MKQATHALQIIERTSHILFWAMVTGIVMLASVYIYLVNRTVWNVVARQTAESQIVALNSDLSASEFEYINTKSNVTMALAAEMGFKSADQKTLFVTRESSSKNVALR
ncbi:MAG: hypothetical protein V4664_01450 [Patescibacteria group bacterium]